MDIEKENEIKEHILFMGYSANLFLKEKGLSNEYKNWVNSKDSNKLLEEIQQDLNQSFERYRIKDEKIKDLAKFLTKIHFTPIMTKKDNEKSLQLAILKLWDIAKTYGKKIIDGDGNTISMTEKGDLLKEKLEKYFSEYDKYFSEYKPEI